MFSITKEDLINKLESGINNLYIPLCKSIKKYDKMSDYIVDICNERSIAFFSNTLISNIVFHDSFKVFSELNIKPNKTILLGTKTINGSTKEYKRNMIPDGYYIGSGNKQYFIEYKVEKKYFRYVELANDFLKFFTYTNHSKIDSTFLYFDFKVNCDKYSYPIPTLVSKEHDLCLCQITSSMKEESIIDDASLYYYEIDNSSRIYLPKTINDDNVSIEKVQKCTYLYSSIISIIEENDYLNNPNESNNYINFQGNQYYKARNIYKNNVLTSNFLKQNYKEIDIAYTFFKENSSFFEDCFKKIFAKNGGRFIDIKEMKIINFEQFEAWSTNYFNNFINNLNKNFKKSNNTIYYSYNRRSTIIYIIIHFAYKIISSNSFENKISYDFIDNHDSNKDYKAVLDTLSKYYNSEQTQKNIFALAMSFALFVHNFDEFL